jgi:hypothetical protein
MYYNQDHITNSRCRRQQKYDPKILVQLQRLASDMSKGMHIISIQNFFICTAAYKWNWWLQLFFFVHYFTERITLQKCKLETLGLVSQMVH